MPYLADLGRTRRYDTAGIRRRPSIVWQDTETVSPQSTPLVVLPDRVVIGGSDGLVRCLGLRDGRELWRYDAGGPVVTAGDAAADQIVIATNRVYSERTFVDSQGYWTDAAPFADGSLHALSPEGVPRWRQESESGVLFPTFVGDHLYFMCRVGLVTSSAADGTELWWYEIGTPAPAATAFDVDLRLAVSALNFVGNHVHGGLHAIDIESGDFRWGVYDDEMAFDPCTPLIAHGSVWAAGVADSGEDGSYRGVIARFDASSGEVLARIPFGDDVHISCLAADETGLLVSCERGAGSSLSHVSAGTNESRVMVPDISAAAISVSDGVVYAAATAQLQAIDSTTGEHLWDLDDAAAGTAHDRFAEDDVALVPTEHGLLWLAGSRLALWA